MSISADVTTAILAIFSYIYNSIYPIVVEAIGLCPERFNYGEEAVQTLLENMSKPEYSGNLIVILIGQTEHIEKLFDKCPTLR